MTDRRVDLPPPPEDPTAVWSHGKFVDRMAWAASHRPFSDTELPRRIELSPGRIGEVVDEILVDTLADPQRRERYRYAKLNLDGKFVIPKRTVVVSSVGGQANMEIRSWTDFASQHRHSETPLLDMHTHGIQDNPPSGTDLGSLLRELDSDGLLARIIATPTTRLLLMRTLRTPEYPTAQVTEMCGRWDREILGEYERRRKILGSTVHGGTFIQINMGVIKRLCDQFRIRMYSSNNNNSFIQAV